MLNVVLLITEKDTGWVIRRCVSYRNTKDLKKVVEYISKYSNVEKVEVLYAEQSK